MSEKDVSIFHNVGRGSVRCICDGLNVRVMLTIIEKTGAINLDNCPDVQIDMCMVAAVLVFLFSCKDTCDRLVKERYQILTKFGYFESI